MAQTQAIFATRNIFAIFVRKNLTSGSKGAEKICKGMMSHLLGLDKVLFENYV